VQAELVKYEQQNYKLGRETRQRDRSINRQGAMRNAASYKEGSVIRYNIKNYDCVANS